MNSFKKTIENLDIIVCLEKYFYVLPHNEFPLPLKYVHQALCDF